MQLEQQTLRETCEELRQREGQISHQLSITDQLYQKLKQQYTQEGLSPGPLSAHHPAQLQRVIDPHANPDAYSKRPLESQYWGPGQEMHERAIYDPDTTGPYSKVQQAPAPVVGGAWSKPAPSHCEDFSHRAPSNFC